MKNKFISMFLGLTMAVSMAVPVFATQDFTDSPTSANTPITYTSDQTASYTVTVPMSMEPGDSGSVSVSGTWGAAQKVAVATATNVTITNEDGTNTKSLAVTFDGIDKIGDNGKAIQATDEGAYASISLADVTGVAFGEWTGVINFEVELMQENEFFFNVAYGISPIYKAEEGMTFEEWVNSEYNTDGYIISNFYNNQDRLLTPTSTSNKGNYIDVLPSDIISNDNEYIQYGYATLVSPPIYI